MLAGTGLLETLRLSTIHWRMHRAERKHLRHWLKAGKVTLDNVPTILGALIAKAIACRAEEVLIARRELRGLFDIETHPDFWNPDHRTAFEAGLQGDQWASPAGLAHFAHYSGFSRFDEYHQIDGRVELVGGHRLETFRGYLAVLSEVMTTPAPLTIAGELWDTPGTCGTCTVSQTDRACGVEVGDEGIGLRIAYDNDAPRRSHSPEPVATGANHPRPSPRPTF
jgi:hypothetical protein